MQQNAAITTGASNIDADDPFTRSNLRASRMPGPLQYGAAAGSSTALTQSAAGSSGGGGPYSWVRASGQSRGFACMMMLLNEPATITAKKYNEKLRQFPKYAFYELMLIDHPGTPDYIQALYGGYGQIVDEGATLQHAVLQPVGGGGAGYVPSDNFAPVLLRRGAFVRPKRFKAVEPVPLLGRNPKEGDIFFVEGLSCSENFYEGRLSVDWRMNNLAYNTNLLASTSDLADRARTTLQLYLPHSYPPPVPIEIDPAFNMAEVLNIRNQDTGELVQNYMPTKDDFKNLKMSGDHSLKSIVYENLFLSPRARRWLQDTDKNFYLQIMPSPSALSNYFASCATCQEYVRWDHVSIDLSDPRSLLFTKQETQQVGEDDGGGAAVATAAAGESKPRYKFDKYGTVMRRAAGEQEFREAERFVVSIQMWGESLRWYGMEEEYNQLYVLPSLFLATPCVIKCYVDAAMTVTSSGKSEPGIDFSFTAQVSSGKKEEPKRGTFPDLEVGIVSAGYEVPHADVIRLLEMLSKKNPKRYQVNMRDVEDINSQAAIRDNVLRLAGSKDVFNVLACQYDIPKLASTHRFYIVSNWWFKDPSMRPALCARLAEMRRSMTYQERVALFGQAMLQCASSGGVSPPKPDFWQFGPLEDPDEDRQREAAAANKFQYAVFGVSIALLKRRGLLDYYGVNAYLDVICPAEEAALASRKPVPALPPHPLSAAAGAPPAVPRTHGPPALLTPRPPSAGGDDVHMADATTAASEKKRPASPAGGFAGAPATKKLAAAPQTGAVKPQAALAPVPKAKPVAAPVPSPKAKAAPAPVSAPVAKAKPAPQIKQELPRPSPKAKPAPPPPPPPPQEQEEEEEQEAEAEEEEAAAAEEQDAEEQAGEEEQEAAAAGEEEEEAAAAAEEEEGEQQEEMSE